MDFPARTAIANILEESLQSAMRLAVETNIPMDHIGAATLKERHYRHAPLVYTSVHGANDRADGSIPAADRKQIRGETLNFIQTVFNLQGVAGLIKRNFLQGAQAPQGVGVVSVDTAGGVLDYDDFWSPSLRIFEQV